MAGTVQMDVSVGESDGVTVKVSSLASLNMNLDMSETVQISESKRICVVVNL